MSFDGRDTLPGNKGPDEAVELPGKLAELGEQLSDDADSLALHYPAPERRGGAAFEIAISAALCADRQDQVTNDAEFADRQVVRAPAGAAVARWGTVRRWSIVSGACAAMVFVLIASREGSVRWRGDRPPSAAAHDADSPVQPRSETDLGHSSGQRALPREATLLRGLSAAEQEAVLDLLEDGPERSASLSI